jgi:hypothetical protein
MNNAEKFIKIQSVESGNFNQQNNIINFVLPPATYDLKDSYVVLNLLLDENHLHWIWVVVIHKMHYCRIILHIVV